MTKTFAEFTKENADKPQKPDHKKMRDWVYHNLENSSKTHNHMRKQFAKKFGDHNAHHFDKHVSKYVD